jgi:hypothetical protein
MMSLTGRFNFHKTWRGRLLLEVEEEVQPRWGGEKRRWRRATLEDLAEPEMRALIDLRFKPQFMLRVSPSTEIETAQPLPSGVTPLPSRSPEDPPRLRPIA